MNYTFGEIVGDSDLGGVTRPHGCILLDEWTTLAVSTIQHGDVAPAIFLRMSGRIVGTDDTIDATILLPVMDAGNVAGALFGAAERLGAPSPSDFRLGLSVGAAEA